MWLRYLSSAGAGALVAGGLLLWMQLMIAGIAPSEPPPPRLRVVNYRPVDPPPPPPPTRRRPPDRPAEPDPQPDIPSIEPSTQPSRVSPVRPTPPGFAERTGRPDWTGAATGRRGFWVRDGDLHLVADFRPNYPQSDLLRGHEGRVVVEYTVTAAGTVADVVVVESTRPSFERAALSAVAKYRYRPRIVGGHAVDVPGIRKAFVFEIDD